MKSIRKCDEKITAQQLGVKVGDKFVVLPPEESYNNIEYYRNYSCAGDVVKLIEDDGSCIPQFQNIRTGARYYEDFSCLARYEPPAELSLQNVKFDMKAVAEELGVSLEKAHNIVQTALFEKGFKWKKENNTDYVQETDSNWLFLSSYYITFGGRDYEPEYKLGCVKIEYSITVKEENPETIEFNGKQYNKEDVAKALALLSPIENV